MISRLFHWPRVYKKKKNPTQHITHSQTRSIYSGVVFLWWGFNLHSMRGVARTKEFKQNHKNLNLANNAPNNECASPITQQQPSSI
jgi:hypothetical protein